MIIPMELPEIPTSYVWEFGWDHDRNFRIALRRYGPGGLTRQVTTVECFTEPDDLPGRVDIALHEMILKEEQRLQREKEQEEKS